MHARAQTTPSPKHVRLRSSDSIISTSDHWSTTSDGNDEDTRPSASHPSHAPSRLHATPTGLQPSSATPTQATPKIQHTPVTPRRSLGGTWDRFTSHETLYSPDDKFTQIPLLSPRERRASGTGGGTPSQSAMLRKRKSLASLNTSAHQYGSTPGSSTPSHRRRSSMGAAISSGSGRATPSGGHMPSEGRTLSRKHVEASRRAAKEALEEDLRALALVQGQSAGGSSSTNARDDYVLDCYFTSLDYLLKSIKHSPSSDSENDLKTQRAIRARLQAVVDSLAPPPPVPEVLADPPPLAERSDEEELEQAMGIVRCACGRRVRVPTGMLNDTPVDGVQAPTGKSQGIDAFANHARACLSALKEGDAAVSLLAWVALILLQLAAFFEPYILGTRFLQCLAPVTPDFDPSMLSLHRKGPVSYSSSLSTPSEEDAQPVLYDLSNLAMTMASSAPHSRTSSSETSSNSDSRLSYEEERLLSPLVSEVSFGSPLLSENGAATYSIGLGIGAPERMGKEGETGLGSLLDGLLGHA